MADSSLGAARPNWFDHVTKSIHDDVVEKGEYRVKRDDETWFAWWRAYSWDVLGEREDFHAEAWQVHP